MGRIVAQLVVENVADPVKRIETHAMVDTGVTYLTLPMAWQARLGEFEKNEEIEIVLADGVKQKAILCGPVKIKIDENNAVYNEVLFVEMEPEEGQYSPLLGYIPLETGRLAVDMLGHRLVPVKYADLR